MRNAAGFRAQVFDRCGRINAGRDVARLVDALVRGESAVRHDGVVVSAGPFPEEVSSVDTTLGVLVMMCVCVASVLDDMPTLDPASCTFLPDFRLALANGFSHLRGGADRRGEDEVQKEFESAEGCLDFLRILGSRVEVVPESRSVAGGSASVGSVSKPSEDMSVLRLLTWNIAGENLSAQGPLSWTVREKMLSLRAEIRRLRVDVLALQEAPGPIVCSAVPADFELIDSVESHAGFVQLYCRTGLQMKRVRIKDKRGKKLDVPAVAGGCLVNDKEVLFASVHLSPHADGLSGRREQVRHRAVLRGPLLRAPSRSKQIIQRI